MELSVAITILLCVISVINFVLSRKDKAVNDTKQGSEELADQKLIDYRLKQVENKLDKILKVLEDYNKEIDERINLALERHVEIYHRKEG